VVVAAVDVMSRLRTWATTVVAAADTAVAVAAVDPVLAAATTTFRSDREAHASSRNAPRTRGNGSCITALGGAESLEATMRDSRSVRAVVGFSLCLVFTARPLARADSALPDTGLVDSLKPHMTWGPSVRVGTVVGAVEASAASATSLGLAIAAGHRFGRLAIESELTLMTLEEPGPSSLSLGRAERLGVIVRYDVVRFTADSIGPNTLIGGFVEGGAAQSWAQWYEPGDRELPRNVPADTRRVEGQAGMGVSIDHRLQDAHGSLSRVAWHLGWRFAAPSLREESGYACRGACRLASEPIQTSEKLERSVLFQSSLAFTW
jgi:hypothetical protein